MVADLKNLADLQRREAEFAKVYLEYVKELKGLNPDDPAWERYAYAPLVRADYDLFSYVVLPRPMKNKTKRTTNATNKM